MPAAGCNGDINVNKRRTRRLVRSSLVAASSRGEGAWLRLRSVQPVLMPVPIASLYWISCDSVETDVEDSSSIDACADESARQHFLRWHVHRSSCLCCPQSVVARPLCNKLILHNQ